MSLSRFLIKIQNLVAVSWVSNRTEFLKVFLIGVVLLGLSEAYELAGGLVVYFLNKRAVLEHAVESVGFLFSYEHVLTHSALQDIGQLLGMEFFNYLKI